MMKIQDSIQAEMLRVGKGALKRTSPKKTQCSISIVHQGAMSQTTDPYARQLRENQSYSATPHTPTHQSLYNRNTERAWVCSLESRARVPVLLLSSLGPWVSHLQNEHWDQVMSKLPSGRETTPFHCSLESSTYH